MTQKTFFPIIAALSALLLSLAAVAPAQEEEFDKGPELEQDKDYYAVLFTSKGEIPVRLFEEKTPKTVRNFVNLAEGTAEFQDPRTGETVKRPFYNGVLFHRVIPQFMIQTGDPTGTGYGGPGYEFGSEFDEDLRYDQPGRLGMANTNPDDNGSQFFITEKAYSSLNDSHTLFGQVLEASNGLQVVEQIARVDRDPNDKPREPVFLERVEIVRLKEDLPGVEALQALREETRLTAQQPEQSSGEPGAPAQRRTINLEDLQQGNPGQ